MKIVNVCLFVLLAAASSISGPGGVITNTSDNLNQAANSAADWYTMKKINISALAGDISVSATWPGHYLKGFYNPRRDSSLYVNFVTARGDTIMKYSIPAEYTTPKLPSIKTVFKSGTSDSLVFLFQKE